MNHQQPDRVPVDVGSHRSSGIEAIAYPIQQLAVLDDVLKRFGRFHGRWLEKRGPREESTKH